MQFARLAPEVGRSSEYVQLWEKVYPMLAVEKVGNWGAATGRAEAQVTRLAMVYALLDCTDTINAAHLRAALAVWEYCDASARFIFGGQVYDAKAAKVLEALKGGPLSQTEIIRKLGGHLSGQALRVKLEGLSAAKKIGCRECDSGGVRKKIEWFLI